MFVEVFEKFSKLNKYSRNLRNMYANQKALPKGSEYYTKFRYLKRNFVILVETNMSYFVLPSHGSLAT